jgi:ribonucleotide reductase alpha subunit
MRVKKRNGDFEPVSFDKVLNRIQKLSKDLDVDAYNIAQIVNTRINDGISTTELDEFAANSCSSLISVHPDYDILASRIAISNHHKNTSPSFTETIYVLYNNKNDQGEKTPLISSSVYTIVMKNKKKLNAYIDSQRDYLHDYFGFKTLEKAYLLKVDEIVVERPQYMWMRVALGIHGNDFKDALETYDLMSQKYFTHATPTLYNCGTPRQQLSSCFLMMINDDSISGIYDTLKECALISKHAGGIGLHIHNIRGKGSRIHGNNGVSTGIVPMLRVFNYTAKYVDQAGRRPGAIAIYLEPWHSDIENFLELKKNNGKDEDRARDLFYALWIPDLFMERVKNNENWSIMSPDASPGLSDLYGDKFTLLYKKYEKEGRYIKQVNAQELFYKILQSQMETGVPYILYKDQCNKKSNQKNLGTIKSSNLCTEIVQYTSKDEISTCNLASICLPTFIKYDESNNAYFDFSELHRVTMIITKNLNKVIDINYYPVDKARNSNLKHRPIGLGVQGLADTFALMKYPFDSPEAKRLNKDIFETIYHGSLTSSMLIAKKRHEVIVNHVPKNSYKLRMIKDEDYNGKYPGAYSSFIDSPAQQGILQFDMWDVDPGDRYDWDALKSDIKKWGIRNSLLVAPMPTASTSQIMGFTECFEPFNSNIYKRKTMSGEFIVINKYLIRELIKLNIWNEDVKNQIIMADGSIQHIEGISDELKKIYKTVWEISMKTVIDLAADRGPFICQSQSMNLWMEEPTYAKLTSMMFYAYDKKLKTGQYYLRSRSKARAQKFTIDPKLQKLNNAKEQLEKAKEKIIECTGEVCTSCSA